MFDLPTRIGPRLEGGWTTDSLIHGKSGGPSAGRRVIGSNHPPASILILLLLFARVMPRIMSGQYHYRAFVNALPSFANLLDIETRCAAAAEPAVHPHDRLSLTRELAADGVSFTYSEGRVPAVRDLSLVIPAGKIVALVGRREPARVPSPTF